MAAGRDAPLVAAVDVAGLRLRVVAADGGDLDLVQRVLGTTPVASEPDATLTIGMTEPGVPCRPPDFQGPYGDHWVDGPNQVFRHAWGFGAEIGPDHTALGGPATGYRRWVAVRNSMLFVLGRLMLARGRFLLHGAAVRRHGSGLLIVGDSGSGKSSLAFAAHGAGWRVLGDDMVVVDAGPGGVTMRGIARRPTVPGELAAGSVAGDRLPHDDRQRLELAQFPLDHGTAAVTAVVVCGHDDGPGRVESLSAVAALGALVPAFVLSALPEAVTAWFPSARRLALGPRTRLLHAADAGERLRRAEQLLDQARQHAEAMP